MNLHVYMYIHIYTYVSICVYLYICIYSYIYIYKYVYIHIHIYIHVHIYVYTYLYTYVSICVHVCMYAHICIHNQRMQVYEWFVLQVVIFECMWTGFSGVREWDRCVLRGCQRCARNQKNHSERTQISGRQTARQIDRQGQIDRQTNRPTDRQTGRWIDMGWLQLVGSLKLQVSFAEYRLFYRDLLQKRPIILRSLVIIATPQDRKSDRQTERKKDRQMDTQKDRQTYRLTDRQAD